MKTLAQFPVSCTYIKVQECLVCLLPYSKERKKNLDQNKHFRETQLLSRSLGGKGGGG